MPELLVILLAISNICLIILAVVAIGTALDLRATLRRVNSVLPDAEAALKEARHMLHRTRQIAQRGDLAAKRVATVIHQACDAVGGVLEQITPLKQSVEQMFFRRHKNGAGSEPRRHHRRHG
jgi:uncharacterized protein YoxC